MEILTGTHLGPYEVLSLLGSGGMGKVYRARDHRLDRDVAIKVCALEFSDRFEREARIVARLDHPHICRVYDVGPSYLVMELIEGSPLRVPMPLEDALVCAAQILDALETAHRKGIVHRDLKPGNILMTRQGIKLLDFGLAILRPPALLDATETATVSVIDTNVISGTVRYMSPEQLSGKEVDARSDLFSFGVLFYELVNGRPAFDDPSVAGVIASILGRQPPALNAPAAIDRVIRRTLAKDPNDRFQTAADLKTALQWAAEPVAAAVVERKVRRDWQMWFAAGVAGLAAIGLALLWLFPHRTVKEPFAFSVEPPPGVVFNYLITATAISPNGRMIVFRAAGEGKTPSLWLRPLDSLTARQLAGTTGGDYPFWSADSKSIAFFAGDKLERIDLQGGPPTVLCDADAANAVAGGAWNRDGSILFADRWGLHTVPGNGGTPTLILKAAAGTDEGPYGYPQFLPDGVHYLYFRESRTAAVEGIYAGSLASPQARKMVLAASSKAIYAPPISDSGGQLLFVKGNALFSQAFDPGGLKLRGEPAMVAANVSVLPAVRGAAFWVSETGTLIYRSGLGLGDEKIVWMNRDGGHGTEAAAQATYTSLRLTEDGKRAVVGRQDESDFTDLSDLWILDFERHATTRFTFGPEWNACPVWSPDGKRVAFVSSRTGNLELYAKEVQSGGSETPLPTPSPEFKCPLDWSRDGQFLLFAQSDGGVFDIWALPMSGSGKPFLVVGPPFDKPDAQFSPDGHWVAYTSNEAGRYEVYLKAFQAGPDAGPDSGAVWQVSNNGGRAPRWRGDGKELYFASLDNRLKAVPMRLTAQGGDPASVPQDLFGAAIPGNLGENQYPYDVSADGQRFLVEQSANPQTSAPLIVLVNWQTMLRK